MVDEIAYGYVKDVITRAKLDRHKIWHATTARFAIHHQTKSLRNAPLSIPSTEHTPMQLLIMAIKAVEAL